MKSITIFIFVCYILTNCNDRTSKISIANGVNTGNLTKIPIQEATQDTLVKISKPFTLNGIECYWKHQNIANTDIIIQLLSNKTNKILLEHLEDIFQPTNYNADDFFTEVGNNGYTDVNFDGFTDILIRSYTNTIMSDVVYVYLFNPKAEEYTVSDELSDNRIDIVDKQNRRLITGNEYRFGTDSIIHSFDKKGQIKYKEVYSNYRMQNDTTWFTCKDYQKLINGKLVIERRTCDTIKWE